ncbi:sensor histidine kinase [Goodfellowiella coeruleoviolacea]|uniref:histidine kinase n=1 Tax=Goodfellowiella coeruleoviolacea TaxID=334858 RepID=A0AAE3KJI0_9PSEU|nr:sensor histidine kinase [Goodfellowiella coeruleoviolacea]MCP2169102.1 Signal transduction histidine kinase [Goodfellowiella coeruleoviolacea]
MNTRSAQRPVRTLAYLVSGLLVGPAALLWTLFTTLASGVLSLTYLGPPVFLVATWGTRRIAGLERARAALVLGRRVAPPYVPTRGTNPWARGRDLVRQPATWRDLSWLALLFPVGLGCGVAGVVAAAVPTGAVLAPLWLWAVPNPHLPALVDPLFHSVPGRFALSAVGVALAPLAWWLARVLAAAQAGLAEKLLAPGPRQRLADRAEALAVTRRRVVDAQAAELQRIERDLHDGAQAHIVAAGMTLALAERRLRAAGQRDDPVHEGVRTARRQLDSALTELRRLVRGIYPPILTDRGLVAALAALAGDAPLAVDVRAGDVGALPAAVEAAAYFVVAEALTNAAKHSGADECVVELVRHPGGPLALTVRDNGHGGADPAGSGLTGLRRRVEALDGTLVVTSPPGGPTVVRAELPGAV